MIVAGQPRMKLEPFADLMRHMRIPERFWQASVADIQHDRAAHAIRVYLRDTVGRLKDGDGLLFWGPNGVGKTCAAVVVAKEARRWGASVFFTTVASLRQSFIDRELFDEHHGLVIDRAKEVDVLVLDDLGKEPSGDGTGHERFMENLLRVRSSHRRTTIVTTNMDFDTLRQLYKISMMEVIKESLVPVSFAEGENRRNANAKALLRRAGME